MTFKNIANQFYLEFDKVCKLIRENIDYNNTINIHPTIYGISVNFMFRGECDYSLMIPLEYCDSGEAIKDYYNRFKKIVEDEPSLSTYDQEADKFFENEIQSLGNKQWLYY